MLHRTGRFIDQVHMQVHLIRFDVLEEKRFVERYEQYLLMQLDDALLVKIFSGLCRSEQ
jgi:hypothetical protein